MGAGEQPNKTFLLSSNILNSILASGVLVSPSPLPSLRWTSCPSSRPYALGPCVPWTKYLSLKISKTIHTWGWMADGPPYINRDYSLFRSPFPAAVPKTFLFTTCNRYIVFSQYINIKIIMFYSLVGINIF
jgi:hypothetical protein